MDSRHERHSRRSTHVGGRAPIIWLESPEQALADPIRFMAYARHEDMRVIRRYVSDDDLHRNIRTRAVVWRYRCKRATATPSFASGIPG